MNIDDMYTDPDMDKIREMLETAKSYKLETEVVYSFAQELKNNSNDIEYCVLSALSEWDLI